MPWLPFDSAPKLPRAYNKGPCILAYRQGEITIAYWQYGDSRVPGWWVDMTLTPSVLKDPTHWMPMPVGPGDEG